MTDQANPEEKKEKNNKEPQDNLALGGSVLEAILSREEIRRELWR